MFGMQPVKITVWDQLYLRGFINPQTSLREFDDLIGVSQSLSLLKDKGCWVQDPSLCLLEREFVAQLLVGKHEIQQEHSP